MPRQMRVRRERSIYHVMMRGNNNWDVYPDNEDKSRIRDIIFSKKEAGSFYII